LGNSRLPGEREDSHFTLGPLNLTLCPGELVFVVGGNGSGKSTLVKLLTGLYAPETGAVEFDSRQLPMPIVSGIVSNFQLCSQTLFV